MFVKHIFEKNVSFFQFFYNKFVRVLDEHAFIKRYFVFKSAAVVYHLNERKVVFLTDSAVVDAERRGDMDYARTIGKRDVIVVGDVKRLFAEGAERAVVHRLVFRVLVVRAFLHALNFVCSLFEKGRDKSFGKYIRFAVRYYFRIVFFGVHTERDVRGERPGRGRPNEKILIFAFKFEFDENRFFLYVLVPLRDFVACKRGAATRAVRNDFITFI